MRKLGKDIENLSQIIGEIKGEYKHIFECIYKRNVELSNMKTPNVEWLAKEMVKHSLDVETTAEAKSAGPVKYKYFLSILKKIYGKP